MKRLVTLGFCMALLGCLGGSDDGTDPAASSLTGTETETAGEVTVTARVGFGQSAPNPAAPSIALAARPLVQQERVAEEVINLRSVFSPENLRRTEPFRIRMGVQQ